MALTISTNIPSLNAQRHLSANQGSLATTMQRLSSGLRVNSAKDAAAGLAISERMLTQVKGMDVAKRNANDGISLAQVAEGAMQKMTDILQRGRELAVQAANGTNSKSDRQALFAEYSQLLQEFSRMSRTSNFNGHNLLDGTFSAQNFQVGANAGDTIGVSISTLKETELGFYRSSTASGNSFPCDYDWPKYQEGGRNFDAWFANIKATTPSPRVISVQGRELSIDGIWNVGGAAKLINAQEFEPEITATTETSISFTGPVAPGQVTLRLVAGEDYSKAKSVSFYWDGSAKAAQDAMDAINKVASTTGVRAEKFTIITGEDVDGNSVSRPYFRLVNTDGENLHILNDSNPAANIVLQNLGWDEQGNEIWAGGWNGDPTVPSTLGNGVLGVDDVFFTSSITLESDGPISYRGDATYDYNNDGDEIRTGLIGSGYDVHRTLDQVSYKSTRQASDALRIFDAAINQVTAARAQLGALQSRFESVINNLDVAGENTAASRARIVDADHAQETAQLARQQILQQAGTAMVAQANSMPQQVLQLLKGV